MLFRERVSAFVDGGCLTRGLSVHTLTPEVRQHARSGPAPTHATSSGPAALSRGAPRGSVGALHSSFPPPCPVGTKPPASFTAPRRRRHPAAAGPRLHGGPRVPRRPLLPALRVRAPLTPSSLFLPAVFTRTPHSVPCSTPPDPRSKRDIVGLYAGKALSPAQRDENLETHNPDGAPLKESELEVQRPRVIKFNASPQSNIFCTLETPPTLLVSPPETPPVLLPRAPARPGPRRQRRLLRRRSQPRERDVIHRRRPRGAHAHPRRQTLWHPPLTPASRTTRRRLC